MIQEGAELNIYSICEYNKLNTIFVNTIKLKWNVFGGRS